MQIRAKNMKKYERKVLHYYYTYCAAILYNIMIFVIRRIYGEDEDCQVQHFSTNCCLICMYVIEMFRILRLFWKINFPRNAICLFYNYIYIYIKKGNIVYQKFPQLKRVTVSVKSGDLQRQGVCRVLHSVLHSRGSACCLPAKGRCLQERIRGPEVVGSTAPAITQTCMAIPISSSTRDRVGNQRVCMCVLTYTQTPYFFSDIPLSLAHTRWKYVEYNFSYEHFLGSMKRASVTFDNFQASSWTK